MHRTTTRRRTRRDVPEARVTGRPRLVIGRAAGSPELADAAAYAVVTLALTAVVVLPAVLGRYS